MAIWQWLLDSAGFVLLLVLLYGLALVVRRRALSRHGGTFELSVRVRSGQAGRGWVLGLGRYDGERLEWFRIFSVAPRPKRVWHRAELAYESQRTPEGSGGVHAVRRAHRGRGPHHARTGRAGDEPERR